MKVSDLSGEIIESLYVGARDVLKLANIGSESDQVRGRGDGVNAVSQSLKIACQAGIISSDVREGLSKLNAVAVNTPSKAERSNDPGACQRRSHSPKESRNCLRMYS